jgi:hypothetical protein
VRIRTTKTGRVKYPVKCPICGECWKWAKKPEFRPCPQCKAKSKEKIVHNCPVVEYFGKVSMIARGENESNSLSD